MCDIRSNNIDGESFDCFDPSSYYVTYRARLSGTPETDSHMLISYIEDWVSSGPNVRVQGVLMRVDNTCPVTIASIDDDLCNKATASTSTENRAMTSSSSQSSLNSTAAIIGGVVAVVLIVALTIIVAILALVWKNCRGQLAINQIREE